jgi:gamma-glutamyltranspeptidase/glutathione hydrolase
MVYYDAKTGKTHSLHAGWNTVKGETDPMSIPVSGTPSGRQVLVPGFMAGVQAAHQRFGKLPFAALFEPAIYFAEKGFIIDKALAVRIKSREQEIARFPETKNIFTGENGEPVKEGDLLKQPRLAETLRKMAKQGADYMYRGEWAKKFVRAVRKQGGKMTLKDLEDYKAIWWEPAHTTYREYDIFSTGAPGFAGASLIGAFNLLELADLRQYGHYTRSAGALYQFIQVSRVTELFFYPGLRYRNLHEIFSKYFGTDDFSLRSLISKQTAQSIWKKMQEPSWREFQQDVYLSLKEASPFDEAILEDVEKTRKKKVDAAKNSGHSDCVVAIGAEGNMAAVLHSLNSNYYGFGLMVDGVSIADTGSSMQEFIAEVGPGARLPDSTHPVIVLKKGKPFLAASCIGSIHIATLQCVVNVLDYNMDPQQAVEMPYFFSSALHPSEYNKQTVPEGQFAEEILEAVRAMGQEIKVLPPEMQWLQMGGWVGIKIDPETGKRKGGVPLVLNGIAVGY